MLGKNLISQDTAPSEIVAARGNVYQMSEKTAQEYVAGYMKAPK